MKRVWILGFLLVLNGCLTEVVLDAIDDAGDHHHHTSQTISTRPAKLLAAERTPDGVYHLSTEYSDGSVYHHVYDPSPQLNSRGPKEWPSAGPGGAQELTMAHDITLPKGGTSIAIENQDIEAPGEGFCFRLHGDDLQLREGNETFQTVAQYPPVDRTVESPDDHDSGPTGRQVAIAFVLPLAVAVDVALVGAYVGALFFSHGGWRLLD